MLVEFIIPTYNRIDLLKCTLSSLVAQYNTDWSVNVVIDDVNNDDVISMINEFNDARIRCTFLDKRYNDLGHTPREVGKQMSEAEYIIMTGDDNYYTPNFVDEIFKTSKDKPGLIYWNMVHSHFDYQFFDCKLGNNQIDMGAFATRNDIAKQIELGKRYDADGYFIMDYLQRFPKEENIKIEKILFVHN
jgi:glycosyltransferase involved in cell wall biosynthesis